VPSSPVIYDTATGRRGTRGRIHVDYKDRNRTTTIHYSSGHEIVMQQVAPADAKKRIGPAGVRQIVRIKNPHEVWFQMPEEYGDRFDKIFKKGKYAEKP
jgi:hypothetical protein